jgi:hypothetical protein
MSVDVEVPSHSCAELKRSLSLRFSNHLLPDPATWEHIVVSLSSRKQRQIMEGLGGSHSEASRFATWSVVGRALSACLLSDEDGLYIQSTTRILRRDFLLFARTEGTGEGGTRGIIEVDFTQRLEPALWQTHWQRARPRLARHVKTCRWPACSAAIGANLAAVLANFPETNALNDQGNVESVTSQSYMSA